MCLLDARWFGRGLGRGEDGSQIPFDDATIFGGSVEPVTGRGDSRRSDGTSVCAGGGVVDGGGRDGKLELCEE